MPTTAIAHDRRRFSLCLLLSLVSLAAGRVSPAADAEAPRLSAGDRVRITVYGEDDLTVSEWISDRGTIAYPLLGELRVSGLTPAELKTLVSDRLRGPYLVNPRVSVSVEVYRDFFVTGQVHRPGGFPYTPGLTARKAISLAGGYTERAARSKVFLVAEGEPEKEHRIELDDEIAPGDTVIVKESFF